VGQCLPSANPAQVSAPGSIAPPKAGIDKKNPSRLQLTKQATRQKVGLMSVPTTIEEFLELGEKSGLLEKQALDRYLQHMRASPGLPTAPDSLARAMVRDGLLTTFQAELLLQGKWRGFILADKYRLLSCLGSGGMGTVYLCEHIIMRRRVAVKVLPTSRMHGAATVERFHREARAAAALDHPNIVHAHDVGHDGKVHFLVMEYVDGFNMDELVKREGPLDIPRAARYIAGAACGLQHAHKAGLVHRDIKPANLLIDRSDTIKILDMGLARFFGDESDPLTREHDSDAVLGTADYLAPEQAANSHEVDIRADVYSLGVTFYFLLSGTTPFGAGSVYQKVVRHMMQEPRPLRQLRPDVPEELAAVIAKMMAKDRLARYQDPAEVLEALDPWLQSSPERPVSGPSSISPRTTDLALPLFTVADRAESPAVPRSAAASNRRSQRWHWVAAAIALPALVLIAVLVFIITGWGTVDIEIAAPDLQLTITGEGEEIVFSGTQSHQQLRLKPGHYQVRPSKANGRMKLTPEQFTLKRGEQVTIQASREGSPDRAAVSPGVEQPAQVPDRPGIRLLRGHTAPVEAVAFSPDGSRALSAGHDRNLCLWEIPSGRLLRTLKGHEGPVWCVIFLPDGHRALSCSSDRTLRVWNLASGQELNRFEGHGDEVRALALSSDGRQALSGSLDTTLRLWDVESGRDKRRLEGHEKGVWGVALSADGSRALSAGMDNTVRLWDPKTGEQLRVFEGHTGEVRRVAFSPNGQRALSCGFDMTMRLWDVESGRQLHCFDGQPYYVESVAFSADGHYALTSEGFTPSPDPAVSGDRGIRLWDLDTGRVRYRRGGVPDKVLQTVFSPDGRYALSACDDKIVRLWELPLIPRR
jgi:WD40 repeat protein/serine/threonine protein kinase